MCGMEQAGEALTILRPEIAILLYSLVAYSCVHTRSTGAYSYGLALVFN